MQIAMIGVNHKSASIKVREQVRSVFTKLFISDTYVHLFPYVLLITCNRLELYFQGEDLLLIHNRLISYIHKQFSSEAFYSYFGTECFFHLAKVTSGLDSAFLGESEIQGQVKKAYCDRLKESSPLPSELHFLFQKSLKLGKQMRQNLLPQSSLASSLTAHLPPLCNKKVLFIGASHINRKLAKHFISKERILPYFCNRTKQKAHALAHEFRGKVLPFCNWQEASCMDILIFATKSPHLLFLKEHLRFFKKLPYLVDLSIPFNVDPSLENLINMELLEKSASQEPSLSDLAQLERLTRRQLAIFENKQNKRKAFIARETETISSL